ncbi:hypothetical protein OAG63_01565 [Methylacidiphilales bacterium]|nr:hypothetical protein [Candidatus Methylacidiphilales bacterium]
MTAKTLRKKPAGKTKKPSVTQRSGNAAKVGENIPVKPGASSPETASALQLWEDFERTAIKLCRLSNSAPQTVDSTRLTIVAASCLHMLKKASRLGGEKAEDALGTLLDVTNQGCKTLAVAFADEKSREVLMILARLSPEWPVMISPQKSSHEAVNIYLNLIRVGTSSFPPTSKTRIDVTNPWTKLAVMLLEKINRSWGCLKMQAWKGRSIYQNQKFLVEELPEASKWKKVLDLPLELNKETRGKWWAVAKEILKDYLDANPHEAKKRFGEVKTTAEDEAKSPETIVIKSVREAFYAIVTAQARR